MDDRTKCEIYTKLLNSLNKGISLKDEIDLETYNTLLKLIKTDLVSEDISHQETAAPLMKILVENNVQTIQKDIIGILNDSRVNDELKFSVLESVKSYLKDLLYDGNVTDLVSLYLTWKSYDLEKFKGFLQDLASHSDSFDEDLETHTQPINLKKFLLDHIFPFIMSSDKTEVKQPLIEIANKALEINFMKDLGPNEFQKFILLFPKYLVYIESFQSTKEELAKNLLKLIKKYLGNQLNAPEVQKIFKQSSVNLQLFEPKEEDRLYETLLKCISENKLSEVVKVFMEEQKSNSSKFLPVLKQICDDSEHSYKCKLLLFENLIPLIMSTKNIESDIKIPCIDLGLQFAAAFPLSKLDNDEYTRFSTEVLEYAKNISELRDGHFEDWYKLWIFLVRIFGKKLHSSMTLMNRLLRVVEHAFRNSNYEQRLRGYDCWRELIDNVSLDPQHLRSEKQIKLLLTPLRAKFSKQDAVIVKRFEIFVYLIQKLQENGHLVLKEFLEFCFGAVGKDTDPNKAGQGKSLSELWIRSTKVLLAMLGHSHNDGDQCLDTDSEITLNSPVLNRKNFPTHYYHIINSVMEACILLKDVELDRRRPTIIRCLWTSLLKLMLEEYDLYISLFEEFRDLFDQIWERLLTKNEPYYHSIAVLLFKSVGEFVSGIPHFAICNIKHYTQVCFTVPLDPASGKELCDILIAICNYADIDKDILASMYGVFEAFAMYDTIESNVECIADVWLMVSENLDDYYAPESALDHAEWPARYLHQLKDQEKHKKVCEAYKLRVTKFIEKHHKRQLILYKRFQRVVRTNPLLSKNVAILVTMFSIKMEHESLVNISLDMFVQALSTPLSDATSDHIQMIESYVANYFESNQFKDLDNHTIQKLYNCLDLLIKHKCFNVLVSVEKTLKALPDNLKWIHSKFLSIDDLMDIFVKESDVKTAEKIHKLVEVLRNIKNPEVKPIKKEPKTPLALGGRAAKIAKLVKKSPKSPVKPLDASSPFQLFGKDADTISPLKVKGSHLKDLKETPKKAKTPVKPIKTTKSIPFIDDDSNSKFVLINSEVKVEPNKLTEHQKEALKKRREDIPALYQDLSQSISESLDSNSTCDKSVETNAVFKKPASIHIIKDEVKATSSLKDGNEDINKEIDTPEGSSATNNDVHNSLGDVKKEKHEAVDEPKSTEPKGKKEKDTEIDKNGKSDDTETDKNQMKAAVKAELKKLSMNIVGAEEFLSVRSKRTRRDKQAEHSEGGKVKKSEEKKLPDTKAATKSKTRTETEPNLTDKGTLEKKKGGRANSKNKGSPSDHKSDSIPPTESSNEPREVDDKPSSEAPKVDIYNFSTEDEKIVEQEITPLRSPTKNVETLLENNESPKSTISKRGRKRKSDTPKKFPLSLPEPMTPSRKSKRRSIPTQKFTESELFKSSEARSNLDTPGKRKVLIVSDTSPQIVEATEVIANSEAPKGQKNDLDSIPESQENEGKKSDETVLKDNKLHNNIDEEIKEAKRKRRRSIKLVKTEQHEEIKIDDVTPSQSDRVNNELLTDKKEPEKESRKNKKRKRASSGDESEDIIESSQESYVSNISANKLRISLNRKSTSESNSVSENKRSSCDVKEKTKDMVDLSDSTKESELKHEDSESLIADTDRTVSEDSQNAINLNDTKSLKLHEQDALNNEKASSFCTEDSTNTDAPKELKRMRKKSKKSPVKKVDNVLETENRDFFYKKSPLKLDCPIVSHNNLVNVKDQSNDITTKKRKSNSLLLSDGAQNKDTLKESIDADLELTESYGQNKDLLKPRTDIELGITETDVKSVTVTTNENNTDVNVKNNANSENEDLNGSTGAKELGHSVSSDNDETHIDITPEEKKIRGRKSKTSPVTKTGIHSKNILEESPEASVKENVNHFENKESVESIDVMEVDTPVVIKPDVTKINTPVNMRTRSRTSKINSDVQPRETLDKRKNEKLASPLLKDDNTTGISVSPDDRKPRRRTKKSPVKKDLELHSTLEKQAEQITVLESNDCSGGNNKTSESLSEKTVIHVDSVEDIKNIPDSNKESCFEDVTENKEIEESKHKRKRRKRNSTSDELVDDDKIDKNSAEDKQSHVPNDEENVISACTGKLRRSTRNSPIVKANLDSPKDMLEATNIKRQVFSTSLTTEMDITTTQDVKRRTQSQDTQTQETISQDDVEEKIELQLDLPIKHSLTESEKVVAAMDTETLRSFGGSGDLRTIDAIELDDKSNKTLTLNKTAEVPEEETEIIQDTQQKDVNQVMDINSVIQEIAETEELRTDEIISGSTAQMEFDNGSPAKSNPLPDPADTASLEPDLPSSPITGDTPNRTSELLNNTVDISPIGSKSSSSSSSNSDDEFVEVPRKFMPVALKFDHEDGDHDGNKDKSPEKADDAPEKIENLEKVGEEGEKAICGSPAKDEARTSRTFTGIVDRSVKFFEMVKSGSPATQRLFSKRKSNYAMSPSASRIKKLMSNVKTSTQNDQSDQVKQEDILTFTREVPSPLAVPKSSILKRKHMDSPDEGYSPCAKRKRVHFNDPCTTSKKVFIKENSPTQSLFDSNTSEDDIDKQFLEVLAANNLLVTPTPTESDEIQTEPSLQVENALLLRQNKPIYPDLVGCEDNVILVVRKLTSPMFVNMLIAKLKTKDVKTIGDLASQSEAEVAKYPFKVPVVNNVYKALDNYYHKMQKVKAVQEKRESAESKEQTEEKPSMEVVIPKLDIKEELAKIVEKARAENVSNETLCSLLFPSEDQKEVLSCFRTHFKLTPKDIAEEKDFQPLIKHIIESVGLPRVFEMLTESLESSEDESVYFECMIKDAIDKKSISALLERKRLQDIQAALWENVEKDVYSRKELLNTCFIPFVNFQDLTVFFNKLTVFQLGEVVVNRLKTEDYYTFVNKILEKCSEGKEVKRRIVKQFSVNELTSIILKEGTSKELMSSITYLFMSIDKEDNDLEQLFRLVTESMVGVLPLRKLMQLSIEFQQKILDKD